MKLQRAELYTDTFFSLAIGAEKDILLFNLLLLFMLLIIYKLRCILDAN